jgi:hypothetical protein
MIAIRFCLLDIICNRSASFWVALIAFQFLFTDVQAEDNRLPKNIQEMIERHGKPTRIGVCLDAADGSPVLHVQSNKTFATASAIKTAILIELFSKFSNSLDQVPTDLTTILRDDHPAIAHFDVSQRDEIRQGLSGATIRRIGRVMMGTDSASNLVYNAAANVSIALLGGPEGMTRSIHSRSPSLTEIQVKRYMLSSRTLVGDNTATPESIAAVWRWIANRSIPNVDAKTTENIEQAIIQSKVRFSRTGEHFYKDGALDSLPLTRVYAGCFNDGKESFVYVVMLEQSTVDDNHRGDDVTRFGALATAITTAILKK